MPCSAERFLWVFCPPTQRTSTLSNRPLVCLLAAGDLLCKDDNSEVTMASLSSDPSWCCMFEYGEVVAAWVCRGRLRVHRLTPLIGLGWLYM